MKKKLMLMLSAVLLLTSCSGGGGSNANIEFTDNYGNSYPIQTDKTLTVWCEFPESALKGANNFNDLPLAKQLEKETGIHIEYIHPSDATGESFNLMLASGELPDIIMSRWCQFPGGGDKAVTDGYILPLNEIVKKYSPDFSAALDNYDARKYFSTDEGELFFYPGIWDYDAVNTSGFMLRKDWLDELGLEVPETIDEWEHVLREFKDKKGATAPFTSTFQPFYEGGFSGAYGFKLDFYIEDDEIKNGYAHPEYKTMLETIIRWRDEGLFDKNFSTMDQGTMITNMLTGKTGAIYGAQGSVMGNIMAEVGGQTLNIKPNLYGHKGTYYGICQWSGRYYPQVQGKNLDYQLSFLKKTIKSELNSFGYKYKKGFNYTSFTKLKDAKQAALAFAKCYERCSSQYYSIRQTNAIKAYNYFVK